MENTEENTTNSMEKVMQDVVHAMIRQDAERDFINEALKEMSENMDVPKKVLRDVANAHKKDEFAEKEEMNEMFEEVYTKIFGRA